MGQIGGQVGISLVDLDEHFSDDAATPQAEEGPVHVLLLLTGYVSLLLPAKLCTPVARQYSTGIHWAEDGTCF